MSQMCPSIWAKAQGAIIFPLDLGNKRIPCKLLNRLSLCWEKQRRNLKNVPLLSGGKNSELSPLTWQQESRTEQRDGGQKRKGEEKEVLFNHKMMRSCLQTNIQIKIIASSVLLQIHDDSEIFLVLVLFKYCSNFSKRHVRLQSSVYVCWIL